MFNNVSLILIILASTSVLAVAQADYIFYGGTIYTADQTQANAQAIAVEDDKILYVGNATEAKNFQDENTTMYDLDGDVLYPGFIESHAHLRGLGAGTQILDLTETKSYTEMLQVVKNALAEKKSGEWLMGRGWHQEKWENSNPNWPGGLPTNNDLNALSPDLPILLTRAGGHSALCNRKALEMAGVSEKNLPELKGGEFSRDQEGTLTGMLHEEALTYVNTRLPHRDSEKGIREEVLAAQEEALKNGITCFVDAGTDGKTIEVLKKMRAEGSLKMRCYLMLDGADEKLLEKWYKAGPSLSPDHFLTIRSVKFYADGALGNRGAWLHEHYADDAAHSGIPLIDSKDFQLKCRSAFKAGFQVCSHAIGDRANSEVLDAYATSFQNVDQSAKPLRWRIEHAQHLRPEDISRFGELGVIASMQGIHFSSDRPWADERLGSERIVNGSYAWQSLLKSKAKIVAGTDAPVEKINPVANFHSFLSRRASDGKVYEQEEALSAKETLNAYTADAAYGIFMENYIGSLKPGKYADFTIMDGDLLQLPEKKMSTVKVVMTMVSGEVVYDSSQHE